jgi:hypothetical protein
VRLLPAELPPKKGYCGRPASSDDAWTLFIASSEPGPG